MLQFSHNNSQLMSKYLLIVTQRKYLQNILSHLERFCGVCEIMWLLCIESGHLCHIFSRYNLIYMKFSMGVVISHNFSHNIKLSSFSSHLSILNRDECLAPSFNIIRIIVKVLISTFQPQKFTFIIILLLSQFQRSIH